MSFIAVILNPLNSCIFPLSVRWLIHWLGQLCDSHTKHTQESIDQYFQHSCAGTINVGNGLLDKSNVLIHWEIRTHWFNVNIAACRLSKFAGPMFVFISLRCIILVNWSNVADMASFGEINITVGATCWVQTLSQCGAETWGRNNTWANGNMFLHFIMIFDKAKYRFFFSFLVKNAGTNSHSGYINR